MNADNQTDQDVDYEQTGGGGSGMKEDTEDCSGSLARRGTTGSSKSFPPCGRPDWVVVFSAPGHEAVSSEGFSNPHAKVTLNADWTVTVT
jgi:hypothetical protein